MTRPHMLDLPPSPVTPETSLNIPMPAGAKPPRQPDPPPNPLVADPLDGFSAYAVPDWDGYGAAPVPERVVAIARALLTAFSCEPDIAPGADGSVGMEWQLVEGPLRKLWIDIQPTGEVRIYAR